MTTLVQDPIRLGLIVPGDCHVDDELWALATPEAIPFVTRTRGAADEEMARDGIAETTALAEGPEIGMAAERLTTLLRRRGVRIAGGLLVILFGLWTLPGPHQHWLMGH